MYIASIANDLKIHVWPSGQLVHTYKSSSQGCVKSISWSKDGSWLVLVPNKGHAEIISVRDHIKHLHSIHDIQQPTCAAFQNMTKRNIALGTTTGMVLIYDVKSKVIKKHFPRASSTIFKIEYCATDSFLATACENGETLLYNSITYNLSASYKLPNSKTVSAICCHPTQRNFIAAGSHEGIVGIWDIHTNKLIYHNQTHAASVTDLTFSPLRNDLIVTAGFDRKLAFYDISQKTSIVQTILEKSPTAVDFCPDGVGIAVALHDGTINAYDTRQLNEALYTFKGHNSQIKQIIFQKKILENNSIDYTFTNDSNGSTDEVPTPRTKNLTIARKILGMAIGMCPRDKLFRGYIDLEIQLREFDRCRILYQKFLEFGSENCVTWMKFAELETLLGDYERARAIYELAINQSRLDMPELLWKSYIDFEISQEEFENARRLYERLLERTIHVKVWLSYAKFELSNSTSEDNLNVLLARRVYDRANDCLKNSVEKESRVLLLENWRDFENTYGDEVSIEKVNDRMPRRIKKRQKIIDEDGTEQGWEEVF
ncbi:pre-mrna splicing factor [Holotrichia oblita]|uniref:Pre-mrna splicing factor n=1 Tax=Holotrichia oblita TaxID=644536 RepID=A0ACB9TLU9_HOLOL|nr:pre-mrna splicing factor [Holotrichia oblita]